MTGAYVECNEVKIAASAISVPKLCQVVRKARCYMTTILKVVKHNIRKRIRIQEQVCKSLNRTTAKNEAVQGASNRQGKLKNV
jgi:glutaminase